MNSADAPSLVIVPSGLVVETEMRFLHDGKALRENYDKVVVNRPLDWAMFDPDRNVIPSWIAAIT